MKVVRGLPSRGVAGRLRGYGGGWGGGGEGGGGRKKRSEVAILTMG